MTDRYAVIGNPVAHSKSPMIHAAFARQTGEDIDYGRVLAPLDGFADAARHFFSEGGRGLNVTLPFKQEAYRLATAHSSRARAAEAVNTLRLDDEGIFGDNTDGPGLVRDIRDNAGFVITDRRILLLGAGGAARGVIAPLLEEQPAWITIANRNLDRARELQRQFGASVQASTYEQLSGQAFDLIVNATSASLAGALPPIPEGVFALGSMAYDMMYGKELTPFLARAKGEGVERLADGLGMLVEQAAESFFIWRGIRPATSAVLAGLRAQG